MNKPALFSLLFLLFLKGFCYAENPYLYHSVNVTNGEYCEANIDQTHPDSIQRCYSGGEWLFNDPDFFSSEKGESFFDEETKQSVKEISKNLVYRYHMDGDKYLIDSVSAPGKPFCEYQYDSDSKQISGRFESNGRYKIIEYYDQKQGGRVKFIKAPAGNDESSAVVAHFVYGENETEVFDALGNKKIYRFSDEGKLSAIETYSCEQLYKKERYFWKGNFLINKVLEDGNGVIDHGVSCEYDKKGRLVTQTLYGNLSGRSSSAIVINEEGLPEQNGIESFSKWFVYSEDEKSLLLKEGDDSGEVTRYVYEPFTHWLLAKFTCEGDQIRIRTFFKYDEYGHPAEVIVDDGSSELEKDLNKVSERKMVKYHLIDDADSAAFGKPYLTEQCYLNLSTGKEEVFSRTLHHYNEEGVALQKESQAADTVLDENGNVIATSEGDSQSRFRYDFMNRLIGQENWGANGLYTSEIYRYDAAGNRIEKVDTFGNRTTYEYDALNRLTKETLPTLKNAFGQSYEPLLSYEYDIQDRCVCFVNAKGEKTCKTYNMRGQPTRITYSDGTKEIFEYNLDGTLQKSIDAKGVTSCFEYDYLKRKTAVQVYTASGAFDHESRFHYNAFHLLSSSGPEGSSLSVHYNEMGQQTGISQDDGAEIECLYDASGRVVGTKEWYGDQSDEFRTTYATRNEADRVNVIRMEDAAGRVYKQVSSVDPESAVYKQFQYDHVNEEGESVLALKTTDEKGNTTVVTFDPLNREESVSRIDPFGQELQKVTFFYDLSGNKAREVHVVSTPEGSNYTFSNRFEWGANHKLLTLTEAYGSAKQQSTSYLYNDLGQLISTVKPDGGQLFYEYNALGKLSHFYSSDETIDYTLTYDAKGRVTEIFDAIQNSVSSKEYDSAGRVLEETLGNGLTLKNEYDKIGRRTLLTLPDESSIVYEYDAAFLRAIHRYSNSNEKLYTHEYTEYNEKGYLLSENLPGSCGKVEYQRDEQARCLEILGPHWKQTIQGYDQAGNPLQVSIEDPLGYEETNYSFDSTHQITHEAGEKEFHYEYDSIQNRCDKNGDSYQIDTLNQLLSTEDATYIYDENGNTAVKRTQHHEYQYSYDALNRLTKVLVDEEVSIEYVYDLFNRRLSKKITDADGASYQTNYLYDGDCEIGSMNDEGVLGEFRALGIGKGAEIGAACALELEGNVYIPLHDQVGSVRCLLDMKTKEPVEFYRYSAFGEEEIFDEQGETIDTSLNPWRYLSKRNDSETGLVYFGKRYYEPSIGRFTTKDPMQFLDGPNRYAFVHNNPLTNRDLYGLYSVCECWDALYSNIAKGYDQLYDLSNQAFEAIENKVDYLNLMREYVDLYSQGMIGKMFFILTGYDAGEAERGVYGEGEINENVRITWINGILNIRPFFMESVRTFSETHGGTNIHYVFKPTEGWGRDLMAAVLSILGYTSPDAKRLAHTWKDLLEEMGGVDGDGLIIHYAHSIGGAETYAALHLMTPEERRKIRIITFGSATMIPGHGVESSVNYLSRCDFMGTVHLIESIIFTDYKINYVGSYFGIPFIDHLLDMDTYNQVIEGIGRDFVDKYGSQIGKR